MKRTEIEVGRWYVVRPEAATAFEGDKVLVAHKFSRHGGGIVAERRSGAYATVTRADLMAEWTPPAGWNRRFPEGDGVEPSIDFNDVPIVAAGEFAELVRDGDLSPWPAAALGTGPPHEPSPNTPIPEAIPVTDASETRPAAARLAEFRAKNRRRHVFAGLAVAGSIAFGAWGFDDLTHDGFRVGDALFGVGLFEWGYWAIVGGVFSTFFDD